jgi:predicted metalloprotease with PDZ domain
VKLRLPLCAVLLLAALPHAAFAQATSIEYTLTIKNPLSHLYEVEMQISGIRSDSIDVAMPAWSPGVYAIRDFAGNVQEFESVTRQNRTLQFQKVDKQTWRISKAESDDLLVRYRVYSTSLNDEMADITPAAVFMYVVGQAQLPVGVRYEVDNAWKVHSPLEKRGDRYVAIDYDTLASSPTFIGPFKVLEFKSGNVPYKVVISNSRTQMTELQVEADLMDLADAAAAMFGTVPFKDYTFFVKVQSTSGSISVGYLNSTRLTAGENDFVAQNSYSAFLSAAAQGLSKAWYRRAARARSMAPYDFSREAYSRNFWFVEGVSAYSADRLLLRSKILNSVEYFQKASAEVDALQHQAGRLVTSLEDASWNTWIRSDNAINASVGYILKGKVAGLLLDAEIRGHSAGAKSLDDVLRSMLAAAETKPASLNDNALEAAIQSASGVNVQEFFENVVRGRSEIDYKRYLQQLGISSTIQKLPATIFLGIEFERIEGNLARIRRVVPGSPAETAKLDGGDVLIAMDSERITFDNVLSRIHSRPLGRPVNLSVMRGERLLALTITPGTAQTETWSVGEASTTTAEQLRLRNAWKGSN